MVEVIKEDWRGKVAVGFFVVVTIWWVILYLSGVKETFHNYLFGATYGLIALWGGILGVMLAQKWGGFSSTLGKAIIILAFGLLAQEFGQLVFSFYNIILNIAVPYPSLADIGFFGSIPLYIYGMFLLASSAGVKFSLKTIVNQLQVVVIPLAILVLSYFVFLKDYQLDMNNLLKTFLDFGYPLGEAIYISVALLTYSLSRKLLGGVMRGAILLLIAAFVVQYIADYNFLRQSSDLTWVNGGYGDYLYFVAYFLLALGLLKFKVVANNLGV